MGIYDRLSELDKESPTPPAHITTKKLDVPKAMEPADPPVKNKAVKSENKQANKVVNKQESKQANKSTSKHVYIQTFLNKKAGDTVTFRLPPELMDKFEETQSLIMIKHKAKLKRYEMVVAALAFLLWDFEEKGKESELYDLLIQEKG